MPKIVLIYFDGLCGGKTMPIQNIPSRVRFVCDDEEKKNFSTSHCLVAVSIVGQSKSDGDKFAATLQRINNRFGECTILLGDSLHRHSFKVLNGESLGDDAYYTRSIKEGNAWLSRNCRAVDALTIPHRIMRWDEWLSHANYKPMKKLIDELYEKNPQFRMAMFESVKEYLLRLDKHYIPLNCPNAFKSSAEYLKEECAVMQLMAPFYNYILYPAAKPPHVMQMTYDYLIQPFYPKSLKWVEIKVELKKPKNNNNIQGQILAESPS